MIKPIKRKATRRGALRKRWDAPGRPWYMVCPCSPGRLYTLGPVGMDIAAVMAEAARQGWIYDPKTGWSCPECVRRAVHDQLSHHLFKQGMVSQSLSKAVDRRKPDEAMGRGDT